MTESAVTTATASVMTATPARMTGGGDDAAAARYVTRGRALVDGGNLTGAIAALRDAQRAVGRSHRALRPLRAAVAERGKREVGLAVVRNRCSQAQDIYRQLRSVGAEGPARDQFYGGCQRP